MLDNHGCMGQQQQYSPDTFIKVSQNKLNIRYSSQIKTTQNNSRYMPFNNIGHYQKQNKQYERESNTYNKSPMKICSDRRLNPNKDEEQQEITLSRKSQNNHDISELLYENGLLSQPLPMSHLPRTKNQMELSNKIKLEDKQLIEDDRYNKGQNLDQTDIIKYLKNHDERIFIELQNGFKQEEINNNIRLGKKYFGSNSTANIWGEYVYKQHQPSNSSSRQYNINYNSEQSNENISPQESKQLIQKDKSKLGTNSIATIFQRQTKIQNNLSEQQNEIVIPSKKQNIFKFDYSQSQVSEKIKQQNEQITPLKDNQQLNLDLTKLSQQQPLRQSDSIDTSQNEIIGLTTFRSVDIILPNASIIINNNNNNLQDQLSAASPIQPSIFERNSNLLDQFEQLSNISNNITPTKSNIKQYSQHLEYPETEDKFNQTSQQLFSKPTKSNSHHTQQSLSFINKSSEKKQNFHSIHSSIATSVSQNDMNCFDESKDLQIQIKEQNEISNVVINKSKTSQNNNNNNSVLNNNRTSYKQKQSDIDLSANSFNFISEKNNILNKMSGSYSYNQKDPIKKLQRGISSLQKKSINLISEKPLRSQKSKDLLQIKVNEKKVSETIQSRSKSPLVTKINKINAMMWKVEGMENQKEQITSQNQNQDVLLLTEKKINLMRSSSTSQTRKREVVNGKESDNITPSHNSTFNFKPLYFTQIPHEDITNFLRKSDCNDKSKY